MKPDLTPLSKECWRDESRVHSGSAFHSLPSQTSPSPILKITKITVQTIKEAHMPQAITTPDVHRGWFYCGACGETLPIFYHQRCPTCHSEFTLLAAQHEEQEESETITNQQLANESL